MSSTDELLKEIQALNQKVEKQQCLLEALLGLFIVDMSQVVHTFNVLVSKELGSAKKISVRNALDAWNVELREAVKRIFPNTPYDQIIAVLEKMETRAYPTKVHYTSVTVTEQELSKSVALFLILEQDKKYYYSVINRIAEYIKSKNNGTILLMNWNFVTTTIKKLLHLKSTLLSKMTTHANILLPLATAYAEAAKFESTTILLAFESAKYICDIAQQTNNNAIMLFMLCFYNELDYLVEFKPSVLKIDMFKPSFKYPFGAMLEKCKVKEGGKFVNSLFALRKVNDYTLDLIVEFLITKKGVNANQFVGLNTRGTSSLIAKLARTNGYNLLEECPEYAMYLAILGVLVIFE